MFLRTKKQKPKKPPNNPKNHHQKDYQGNKCIYCFSVLYLKCVYSSGQLRGAHRDPCESRRGIYF